VSHLLLAQIPFLAPFTALGVYWWILMVPLVFGIAVVYRATHDASLDRFWTRAGLFTVKSMVAMMGLALALYLFVYLVIPILPAD
jgi:hypothetical protein